MIAICTSEWMFSTPRGTGLDEAWYPRIVGERFTASTRDGNVDRAPDPVPFIASEISWTNSTDAQQRVWLEIQRAPRTIVAANPNTYVLDDAWSFDIGVSPNAPDLYTTDDGIGARLLITPFSLNQVAYGRLFRSWNDGTRYEPIGTLPPEQTVHARYAALYTSPGQWRAPNTPLQVVRAYWVRLRVWAAPEATP